MNEVSEESSKVGMGTDALGLEGLEDATLVGRAQAGETRAFDQLVTRYRGRAYALIYQMTRNEQDAWDITQDGFLKAWKSIGRFRGQSSFYTWLYRILVNRAIDRLRKKEEEGGVKFDEKIGWEAVALEAVTVPQAGLLPVEKISDAELRVRIDEAIGRLSPEHRAVIILREIEGLDYAEIGERMESSVGTVMSRLFYARKKLQILLRDLYENI